MTAPTDALAARGATTEGEPMNEHETTVFNKTIECHDGWNLEIDRLIDYGYDHRGVDSLAFHRPNSSVEIPVADIPDVIEALQRFVAADDTRPDRA